MVDEGRSKRENLECFFPILNLFILGVETNQGAVMVCHTFN